MNSVAIFAVLAGLGACAKSQPQLPEQAGGSPGSAGAPMSDAAGSRAASAADGGKGGLAPAGSQAPLSDPKISLPPTGGADGAGPGKLLTNVSTQGSGACAGVDAADVIAAMKSAHPELADIPSTRDPGIGGDGSFVFSYLRSDGSFALVVKRGDGDCVSGCISKEYWYFETDAMCRPQQVGHYNDAFDSAGNCYAIQGEPLWGVPAAADPAYVCHAGNAQSNTDDAGTVNTMHDAGSGDVCQERLADFSTQFEQLTKSYRSCKSDDDCVVVSNSTPCHGSCGTIVNREGVDAAANLIASVGAAACDADGVHCPIGPLPPCISYSAGCVDEICNQTVP